MCLGPANGRATLVYPYYALYLVVYARTSPLSVPKFDGDNDGHYHHLSEQKCVRACRVDLPFRLVFISNRLLIGM